MQDHLAATETPRESSISLRVNVIRHSPNGMPLGFVQGHLPKPPPPVVELSELEEINKVVELASDSRETIKKLKQILQELAQDGWA
jgi:hypothetical protein